MRRIVALILALACAMLAGCMRNGKEATADEGAAKPRIPERLETDEDGMPLLKVYDVRTGDTETMGLERYVEGVVAGEMRSDWPEEALKAQAILARTYVLKFVQDKKSKYEGADISTDVAEAQAYDAGGVNDRVRRAVEETEGLVMSVDGEYPYAWFHAHAGGMTELPSVALAYGGGDPAYLAPVESPDSDKAPTQTASWTAEFSLDEVAKACADAGADVGEVTDIRLGEKGVSGRAKELIVSGKAVSAPEFRINIGADALKSTLIDEVRLEDGMAVFSGRGFGHGVGMSQWGAYAMAEDGKSAEEIIRHYFRDVDIVELWDD